MQISDHGEIRVTDVAVSSRIVVSIRRGRIEWIDAISALLSDNPGIPGNVRMHRWRVISVNFEDVAQRINQRPASSRLQVSKANRAGMNRNATRELQ